MNDGGLKDYGLLLISEPYCFRHESNSVVAPPTQHHRWTQALPSERAAGGPFSYSITDIREQGASGAGGPYSFFEPDRSSHPDSRPMNTRDLRIRPSR